MDLAALQLTIDGRPAWTQIKTVDDALLKLPQTAQTIAAQVNAALASIKAPPITVAVTQQVTQVTQAAQAATAAAQATTTAAQATGAAVASTSQQMGAQATAINRLVNSIQGMVAGYIGIRTALSFGNAIVDARIAFEALDRRLELSAGNAAAAAAQFKFLQEESSRIGVVMLAAGASFSRFETATKGMGITGQQIRQTFIAVSEAAQRLGLSAQEVGGVFLALEQMVSKGVVQSQELKLQLGNSLPGAVQIAARAFGVTTAELMKMVEAGDIAAKTFIEKFVPQLAKEIPKGADGAAAALARLRNEWDLLKKAFGESAPIGGVTGFIGARIKDLRTSFDIEAETQKKLGHSFYSQSSDLFGDGLAAKQAKNLNQLFPYAKPYGSGKDDDNFFDKPWIKAYERMKKEQEEAFANLKSGPTRGGLMASRATATKEDADQVLKATEMQEKFFREGLEGFDRMRMSADIAYADILRDIDKLNKISPERRGALTDNAAKAYLRERGMIDTQEERKKGKEQDEKDTQAAKELTAAYLELNRIQADTNLRGLGDRERELAKENARYEEQSRQLERINELGIDITDAAEAEERAHRRTIDAIAAKYAKTYVAEGTLVQMLERRKQIERELLEAHDDPEGSEQVARLQRQAESLNRAMLLKLKTNTASTGDAISFGFKTTVDQWGTEAERMANIGAGVAQSLETNFTNSFTAMLAGTKSFSQGFKDMASSIIQDILRIAVQESISKPLASFIIQGLGSVAGAFGGAGTGSFAGVGGGVDASAASVGAYAGYAHFGGVVGSGGSGISADAAMFRNAPRFHGGGVTGDEMPIVAKRGEVIFTPEQMHALGKVIAKNTGGSAKPVTILNNVSENFINETIAANPDIIVNVLAKRREQVRRIMGN